MVSDILPSGLRRPLLKPPGLAGAFLGALVTSTFGEKLGRRKTIAVGVVVMIIGALLQATAYARAHILVARIVSGMGMGVINSTVPVFQSEFSPKAKRGLCKSLKSFSGARKGLVN